MSSRSRGLKEMTIQTDTAIVPFQGIIHPVRSVNPKIMRYSEANRFLRDDTDTLKENSGQAGSNYGRFGRESRLDSALGENIDIYI
jgi:hypothetical protein